MTHPLDSLFLMNIPFFADLNPEQLRLLIVFGFFIVLVAIRSFARFQRQKMWHDTVRAAIDKGQPIPDMLAKMPSAARSFDLRHDLDTALQSLTADEQTAFISSISKVSPAPRLRSWWAGPSGR